MNVNGHPWSFSVSCYRSFFCKYPSATKSGHLGQSVYSGQNTPTGAFIPICLFPAGSCQVHCNIFHDRLQKYNVNFIGDRIANTDRFCDGKIRSSITYLTFSSWSNNHRRIHRSKIKNKPVNLLLRLFQTSDENDNNSMK